jgi:excisionase family DNA binding protein
MAVLLVVDDTTVRHLAAAVAAHRRRLRLDGVPVPAALTELMAAFQVRSGQDGSAFADLDGANDTPDMALTLDYREAAELLGVSESTVKRLVTDRKLPAVSIGRSKRIRAEDARRFVSELPTTTDEKRNHP